MKAKELMDELFAKAAGGDYTHTCDTLKAGDPEKELSKVAVSCFATPDVIRRASAWGANLLIVHEPTFYDHMDQRVSDPVSDAKLKLLQDSGLTLYRYHDHPHRALPDMICAGELKYLALEGEFQRGQYFGANRFILKTPMTPRELAKHIERTLHIAHVRVCGAMDVPCTRIATCFGTPGGVMEELQSGEIDVVLVGEACEWKLGEYARDAAQLGFRRALLILGHAGSERDGMRYVADILRETHDDFETQYFECGEVYSYAECE